MKKLFLKILFLFTVCCFTLPGLANMARKPHYDDFFASTFSINPASKIKVLNERLIIDFSYKTAAYNPYTAKITAVYEIYSTEKVDSLPLVFVGTNIATLNDFKIIVNEQTLLPDTGNNVINKIPQSWLPPDTVQWHNQLIPYNYTQRYSSPWQPDMHDFVSFTIDSLPVGHHIIKVEYIAALSIWYNGDNLSDFRSLVYILKPEPQTWQSFNNLHLTIKIPEECDYYANLDLKESELKNNVRFLEAHWDELPDRYLSIVLHKSDKKTKLVSFIFLICSTLLILFICIAWLAKTALRKPFPPDNIIRVWAMNYLVVTLAIGIELCFFAIYDRAIMQISVGASLFLSFWIAKFGFPSRRPGRFLLRYLNSTAYLLAVILSALAIIYIFESALPVIISMLCILIALQLVARYSATRRKQRVIVRFVKNMLNVLFVSLIVTIAFFVIYFTNEAIIQNMLKGYLKLSYGGNGYIILAAPFIFAIACVAAIVINFIIRLINYKKYYLNRTKKPV